MYDNNTCIVESFLDRETDVKIVASKQFSRITDLTTHQIMDGESRKAGFSYIEKNLEPKNAYSLIIKPHSYRVFRLE